MSICYKCDVNLATPQTLPNKYKDEDGSKPCLDCLYEMQEEEQASLEEQSDLDWTDCYD